MKAYLKSFSFNKIKKKNSCTQGPLFFFFPVCKIYEFFVPHENVQFLLKFLTTSQKSFQFFQNKSLAQALMKFFESVLIRVK